MLRGSRGADSAAELWSSQRPPLFLALLLLFLMVERGFAGTWKSIGPPGGAITSLAIDPSNASTLYAGSNHGVFKSVDDGHHWVNVSTGLTQLSIWVVAVDPTNSARVYAGTNGSGLFESVDGGGHWKKISDGTNFAHQRWWGPDIRSIAIDPTNPNTLYLGAEWAVDWVQPPLTGGGLFKTTDGGETWQLLPGLHNARVGSVILDPQKPSTVYVSQIGCGAFKSFDGGYHWISLTGVNESIGEAITIDPRNPQTLYAGSWLSGFSHAPLVGLQRSMDGGIHWEMIQACPSNVVQKIAVDPADSRRIYAVDPTEGVFTSDDAGANWRLMPGLPTSLTYLGVTVSSSADHEVLTWAYRGGLFRTTDQGQRWEQVGGGLPGAVASRFAVSRDGRSIFTSDGWRTSFSRDGGSTWVIGSTLLYVNCGADPLIAPGPAEVIYVNRPCGTAVSEDAGASWHYATVLGSPVLHLVVGAPSTQTMLAANRSEVFTSKDSGKTWRTLPRRFEAISVIRIDPTNSKRLLVSDIEGTHISDDGGNSWKTFPFLIEGIEASPGYADDAGFQQGAPWVAIEKAGLFSYADGAWNLILQSWRILGVAYDPEDGRHIAVSSMSGDGDKSVLVSLDSGDTWDDISQGLPRDLQVDELHWTSGNLLAGTESGIWQLDRTDLENIRHQAREGGPASER